MTDANRYHIAARNARNENSREQRLSSQEDNKHEVATSFEGPCGHTGISGVPARAFLFRDL